ncbi:MAG: OmpA family protein [Oryzomonas sp.]|uniref:OmpA family protein n=1 Tax=Oryzomonas sp. TaxID=2855186 RepID=UPI00284A7A88|nr:OmpA family protein [Oryzomonas sp.]MDR3579634.1 OmpA family protein [Oryzomonas sp.]
MKKFTALMLSCVAFLGMATSAVAGEREGAFSVSPFIGGYTFDGVQHLDTHPVYGLRLGYDLTKNWGVEAVGDFLTTDGTKNERSINALSYRLDILYNFIADGPLVPYVAVGGGGITYGHGSDGLKISDRTTDATANAGLGVKYFVTDSIALRGDARQLFVLEDPNSPKYNWEYTAGITFLFGGKTAPAPVAVVPATEPVPVPPAPSDMLTVAPSAITKGQSVTLTWSSTNATNCEIQPEIGAVKPQGSMTITPAENTSYTLTCDGAGGSAKSAANLSVTPPAPLAPTDNLSVAPNSITKGQSATLTWSSRNATTCEIQPEVGLVQPQGSMVITPAENATYTLSCIGAGGTAKSAANLSVIIPAPPAPAPKLCSPTVIEIEFDTNKSNIKPQYHDELKKLGAFLSEFPKATGVIEGHTDNVGNKAANMKLSQRRAESVRNYLIEKFGIAPERIKAVGYGPTKPIASNKTKAGKEQNRRIEANFTCNAN